ncbi:MAG: DUF4340 domain-containing protein [Myxococcaceae bacterium]
MKLNKSTTLALAAFGVLALSVLATREERVVVGIRKLAKPAFQSADVTQIELSGAKTALLKKATDGWTVAEPAAPDRSWPTETAQVDALLQAAATFEAPDLVTDRSDAHAEYEVDAKGQRVQVTTARGKELDVVIGKAAASGGSYVRAWDKPEVFLASGGLTWAAKRGVPELRKRALGTLTANDMRKLSVTSPQGTFVLSRKDAQSGWTLDTPVPKGFRFDAAAAQTLVQSFADIRADDFIDASKLSDDALGFTKPRWTLRAEGEKDARMEVHLGQATTPEAQAASKSLVPVRREGDAETYLISSWRSDQLRNSLDGLREVALLAFDPAQATSIRIVAGKNRVRLVKEKSGWVVKEPAKLPTDITWDPAQVEARLAEWSRQRAVRYAAGVSAPGTTPAVLLEIGLSDGKTQVLKIGAPVPVKEGTPSERLAQGSVDNLTYIVSDSLRQTLERGVSLFNKPPPPPKMGLGGMPGLESLPPEVRKRLEQQLGSASR